MKKENYKSFFNEDTSSHKNDGLELKGLVFIFGGNRQVVLKRKNELDKKPQYYVFDLTTKKYLSSLYPTGEPNTYLFDIKGDGSYLIRFFKTEDNGITYKIESLEKL